jgi:DNA-binding MarR family transcriptional regulator
MLPMYARGVPSAKSLTAFPGFLLSKIGQATTERLTEELAPLKVRPRHFGLLATAAHGMEPASQERLSRALGLVPSAIVGIVDDLERLGAVRRVVDPENRRRNSIELTKQGQTLLARCFEAARQVEDEILGGLSATQRTSLTGLLQLVGGSLGIAPRGQ